MERIERIVFFGTPAFAVPTLECLVAAGRSPVLVVSQPARGVGRGRRVVQPPVARFALDHGLELAQPEKVGSKDFLERLRALEPDLAVVVAFGQIFRQSLLDVPRLGCVNVHASLLPAYRGAAPIVAAVRAGDEVTGVTTMVMERGLDSGPMLLREETPIGPRETGGELTERLATVGGRLLVRTVEALEQGTVEPEEQDHERATFAPRLHKSEGQVDFGTSSRRVDAHVRAFDPWPGTFATIAERPLRLLKGRPVGDRDVGDAAPGTIVARSDGLVVVACGAGTAFGLERVQRPGKKAVSAEDWLNGERLGIGACFELPEHWDADEVAS